MVAYCLVWCCKSNTNTEGIRFFRVTEVRKCAWMKALNRDPIEISCQQRICSLHFSPNDFYLKNGKEHLKSTAVPCLNLTPSSSGVQMEVSFNKGNYHVITQSCHKLGVDPLGADPSAPSTSRIEEHRGQYRPATHSFRELGIDPLGADLYTSSTSGIEQNNVDTNPSISVKLDCTQKQPTDKSICSDSSSALNESPYRTEKRKIKETSSDSEGLKGSPKKRRRLLRTMHTYCKSPRKLNRSVVILKKQSAGLRSIIHNEKRKVIRLKKKVSNLYQIVHELKKRCLISSTATEALEKCCTGIPLALMRRMLGNRNKLSRQKFPEDLRRFAVTLQFYSSKAYAYVRKTFNLALPSPSVIRSWMTNVKCDPGFTEQAFAALKLQIDADKEKGLVTVCSLMLDEMAIKKQIDFAAGKVWGYVNCGSNLDDDELPCATEALVLMVVAVNGRWKIPIAYFLICGLNGNEKANIVKQALLKLHELNIVITSVTCDGPSAHFNMAKQLGAKISDVNNIVPYFPHPADESDVFIVFDVCHMLKLLRNAWGTDVILRDGNNNVLNFDYINKLHRIETTEVLRLGTKIKKAHVEWTKQKMKTFVFQTGTHPNITSYVQCITYNALPSHHHQVLYSAFGMLVTYTLPLVVIIFSYVAILIEIFKRSSGAGDRIRRSSLGFLGRAKIRTLKMTIIIVLVFFVCWTPYNAILVFFWYDRDQAVKLDPKVQRGLFLFACTNSCMNPIVYGVFNIRAKRRAATTQVRIRLDTLDSKQNVIPTPTVETRIPGLDISLKALE